MKLKTLIFAASFVLLSGCHSPQVTDSDVADTNTKVVNTKSSVINTPSANVSSIAKSTAMVVTANPHASKAGIDVLKAGGSAVDAAIAIEAVLSLVEPQSSGLAGGGFMVHFNNATNELSVYDGREVAPSGATETMFLNDAGESIGYINAKHSGLSAGVPGMVSMLHLAHADHGKLPWGQHFSAASKLANNGFAISPRLHSFMSRMQKYIPSTPEEGPIDAYTYFYTTDGEPKAVGSLLKNPAYAKTLTRIASDPREFYEGQTAELIVDQVSQSPRAGSMTLADLKNFQARKQTALCMPYKEHRVCGPRPASSWVGMAAMLGISERGPATQKGADSNAVNWARFADAQRLAYADRDQYVADDTFVQVPLTELIDPSYLAQRASLIQANSALESVSAGDPWAVSQKAAARYGQDATVDYAGTTHFVVVDTQGDVVSLTASVESIFGNARMAGGLFLNNQLTDFSFKPNDEQGQAIANKVAPGKRPRSSMSPTIVLDKDGEFLMATGSPGGNSILAYTAKSLLGVLEWGLSPQQAVELPNMVARGNSVRIEKDRASPDLIQGLRDYGFQVKESAGENSGLSVVLKHSDGRLEGGVDPRREGTIEVIKQN